MRKHGLRLSVFSRMNKKRKLSWRRHKLSKNVLLLKKQRLRKSGSWPRKRLPQLKPLSRLLQSRLLKRKSRKARSRLRKSRSLRRRFSKS